MLTSFKKYKGDLHIHFEKVQRQTRRHIIKITRCDLMEETVGCAATYPSPTYYELFPLFTLILIHANTLRRESAPMHGTKPCIDLTV